MNNGNILIVEDDKKIAEVLKEYLVKDKFFVHILNSGGNVLNFLNTIPIDLVLLDIKLPEKDGVTICREVRSFSNVPIIFVTAMDEDIDRLLGLEIGADDYICKPFLTREVVARIKAVLRRVTPDQRNNFLTVGPVVMNLKSHKVTIGESNLELTPIEFKLLKIMMSDQNQVFTRSELISKIQGFNNDCYDRTIDNHIKNLRKKMGLYVRNKEIIHTVFGVGYRVGIA